MTNINQNITKYLLDNGIKTIIKETYEIKEESYMIQVKPSIWHKIHSHVQANETINIIQYK